MIFKLYTQKMISEPQTGIEPATFWLKIEDHSFILN